MSFPAERRDWQHHGNSWRQRMKDRGDNHRDGIIDLGSLPSPRASARGSPGMTVELAAGNRDNRNRG